MIDRVPDELWTEVHGTVQRQGSRPSPWKRNAKKQNGCLGRPYKYTLEVTNRFKVLDLINRVPKELWTHCTGGSDQNYAKEKEMQKGKVVVRRGFTNN